MTRPNCTACTAATADTLQSLHHQISGQQTTVMLRGFDVQALAGLLEMLAEKGYSNALAANDEDGVAIWHD